MFKSSFSLSGKYLNVSFVYSKNVIARQVFFFGSIKPNITFSSSTIILLDLQVIILIRKMRVKLSNFINVHIINKYL
jgi:hypothetical protein